MSNRRVINFAAGPSTIPRCVLNEAYREFYDYEGTGMNFMELSHRGAHYTKTNKDAQQLLRQLMGIPNNYKIMFCQGGGSGQFSAIPMNLTKKDHHVDYLVSGSWSAKAAGEAKKYCDNVNVVMDKRTTKQYTKLPSIESFKGNLSSNADYIYLCVNETVHGVEFPMEYINELYDVKPNSKTVLVGDISSNILSKDFDVSKFGVLFAGAQKNLGPAGVTILIVREDLIGRAMNFCPSVLDWEVITSNNSVHNTPSTFSVYMMLKVLRWLENGSHGSLLDIQHRNEKKAFSLYTIIDNSAGFYSANVEDGSRSTMNIPFRISRKNLKEFVKRHCINAKISHLENMKEKKIELEVDSNEEEYDDKLESKFLRLTEEEGMMQLKGHRSVGGIRASIYNAISYDDVQILCNFMKIFLLKELTNILNELHILETSGIYQSIMSDIKERCDINEVACLA
ncbi:hypothetical protein SNEBB_000391 [Seison nebaliae]|nr:hypothetical protein SNEBB_000391 [Seison nebaliae]